MPQVGFVKAMKDFFGPRPGQNIMQFGAELRALSHEEKLEFTRGLRAIVSTAPIPSSPGSRPDDLAAPRTHDSSRQRSAHQVGDEMFGQESWRQGEAGPGLGLLHLFCLRNIR